MATDESGNFANGSFDVTVVDTTPPVITVPADFTVEATSESGADVSFDVSATDIADPNPIVQCDAVSGDRFSFGETTVTCTVYR